MSVDRKEVGELDINAYGVSLARFSDTAAVVCR